MDQMLSSIRFRLTSAIVFFFLILLSPLQVMASDKEHSNTYFFAISSCPPWKTKQMEQWYKKYHDPMLLNAKNTCKNSVKLMVEAFSKKYHLPKNHIFKAVDEDATYENIKLMINKIKVKLKKEDRLIVYILMHGAPIKLDDEKYDLLFLWSNIFPKNIFSAYVNNLAVTGIELYSAIDKFQSKNKIFIIDSCYSGIAEMDINLTPRVIFITSSQPKQSSNFTDDYRYALFSKNFADSIMTSSKNTSFKEIFKIAQQQTYKDSMIVCQSSIKIFGPVMKSSCGQMPMYEEFHK